MLNVPYMNYVDLCGIMNNVHAYVNYTSYVLLLVSMIHKYLLNVLMHGFLTKCTL